MKPMISRRLLAIALCGAAILWAGREHLSGYTTVGHKWNRTQVLYYINPQSVWLSASNAVAALQSSADAWSNQSQANIQLLYAGSTSGSSLGLNSKNEVFFRNGS